MSSRSFFFRLMALALLFSATVSVDEGNASAGNSAKGAYEYERADWIRNGCDTAPRCIYDPMLDQPTSCAYVCGGKGYRRSFKCLKHPNCVGIDGKYEPATNWTACNATCESPLVEAVNTTTTSTTKNGGSSSDLRHRGQQSREMICVREEGVGGLDCVGDSVQFRDCYLDLRDECTDSNKLIFICVFFICGLMILVAIIFLMAWKCIGKDGTKSPVQESPDDVDVEKAEINKENESNAREVQSFL